MHLGMFSRPLILLLLTAHALGFLHLHKNKCPLLVTKPNKLKHFTGNMMKIGGPFLERLQTLSDFISTCNVQVDVLKSFDKDALEEVTEPEHHHYHSLIGYAVQIQLLDKKGVPICNEACMNNEERAVKHKEYNCFRNALFFIGLRISGNVIYHDFYDIEDSRFANHTLRISQLC